MPRIDSHVQVFAKASSRFPRGISEQVPADREAPVEKLLAEMEAHKIGQAVLVQFGGIGCEHHAYLLHCLKAYPDRFLGIGRISPESPDPETHMDRLADGTGIIGFQLCFIGGPRDPFAHVDVRQLKAYRIWKHAAERDYVLWLFLRAGDAHLVVYLLEAFPHVRIVFNHLGICPGKGKFSWDAKGRPRIQIAERCSQHLIHTTPCLVRFENVMVQLSGHYAFSREAFPYRDLASCHQALYRIYGAKRLMWASDFPWIQEDPGYGRLPGIIQDLLPDLADHEYQDIMGRTAKDFLRFPYRAAG